MVFFRKNSVKNAITLVIGLVFFNLSFFQIELNSLKLAQKNKQVYENIIKLMAGINEEEKGAAGETSSEVTHAKEVDLFMNEHNSSLTRSFILLKSRYGTHHDKHPASGTLETITQPPEG